MTFSNRFTKKAIPKTGSNMGKLVYNCPKFWRMLGLKVKEHFNKTSPKMGL